MGKSEKRTWSDQKTSWTYLAAYQASLPTISVSHTDFNDDDLGDANDYVLPEYVDTEREIIKKLTYDSLSVESRFVIKLVLQAPPEAMTKGGKVTYRSVLNLLQKKKYHWHASTIERVCNELRDFVSTF